MPSFSPSPVASPLSWSTASSRFPLFAMPSRRASSKSSVQMDATAVSLSSSGSMVQDGEEDVAYEQEVDFYRLGRYAGALIRQMVLISLLLKGFDKLYELVNNAAAIAQYVVPWMRYGVAYLLFVFLSFKSGVLNPLDTRRPTRTEILEVKRPSWFPPPITFPIVWAIIGFVLRPVAAVLAWKAGGYSFLCKPMLAYGLQLSIGDIWNNITNVEQDLGVSFSAVIPVWLSAVYVTYEMYKVSLLAAKVILPLPIWLFAASCITYATWDLNGRKPLLPMM